MNKTINKKNKHKYNNRKTMKSGSGSHKKDICPICLESLKTKQMARHTNIFKNLHIYEDEGRSQMRLNNNKDKNDLTDL